MTYQQKEEIEEQIKTEYRNGEYKELEKDIRERIANVCGVDFKENDIPAYYKEQLLDDLNEKRIEQEEEFKRNMINCQESMLKIDEYQKNVAGLGQQVGRVVRANW